MKVKYNSLLGILFHAILIKRRCFIYENEHSKVTAGVYSLTCKIQFIETVIPGNYRQNYWLTVCIMIAGKCYNVDKFKLKFV